MAVPWSSATCSATTRAATAAAKPPSSSPAAACARRRRPAAPGLLATPEPYTYAITTTVSVAPPHCAAVRALQLAAGAQPVQRSSAAHAAWSARKDAASYTERAARVVALAPNTSVARGTKNSAPSAARMSVVRASTPAAASAGAVEPRDRGGRSSIGGSTV